MINKLAIFFLSLCIFSGCGDIDQTPAGFSAWDGSHYKSTQTIKESMHNPSSYEHVATQDLGNGTVKTTFRGMNGFGGIVTETVILDK